MTGIRGFVSQVYYLRSLVCIIDLRFISEAFLEVKMGLEFWGVELA